MENRRIIIDRREVNTDDELRTCPLCFDSDVIDTTYSILCNNCGCYIDDNPKSRFLGGYKKLWQERKMVKKLNDFL
jgi:hypothetical protein